MSAMAAQAIAWTESGLVPDSVIRSGIRRLLERKLEEIQSGDCETARETLNAFVDMQRRSPIALVPDVANEQHYEVPAAFFEQVLGAHRKYSCGYWPEGVETLDDSEQAALDATVRRADIRNGMTVLDLGCGWGSLSLSIAQRFPACAVTSVSNSRSQRDYIRAQAKELGLENIDVIACDMNKFRNEKKFDRIVSVEMFEHMRNYPELFRRIDGWLQPEGRFFLHIFTHRTTPYEYIDKGPSDWMTRHFFAGGIMPSADLPLRTSGPLQIDRQWAWNGVHYARTCRAWLQQIDDRKNAVMPILAETYGDEQAGRWFMRWRIFFMACEELFRCRGGNEWYVSHYLFRRGRV
ncbi:MAG: cyclopropane-fatty-acyl-phospholipid synthase family protein [Gammaproteobacteria bacterium]|nr:cyclopropane-fatty-acyl-phospholipid synthase family protein [Gammaproteobacteria bacterium]